MNTSKRVMLILGILIIAGFLALLLIPQGESDDLEFEPLDGQFALLERVHHVWFGAEQTLTDAQLLEVKCKWLRYKSLVNNDASEWPVSRKELGGAAMDMVSHFGVNSVYWAGESAYSDLEAIYNGNRARRDQVVASCMEYAPDLSEMLDMDIAAFKEIADREGWFDSDGHIRSEYSAVVRLLHRYIWLKEMSEIFGPSHLISYEERMTVFRWQIEHSSMSLTDKLVRLGEFESVGVDYDFTYARAVLFEKNGMPDQACEALHEGLSKPGVSEFRRDRYRNGLKKIQQAYPAACSNATK